VNLIAIRHRVAKGAAKWAPTGVYSTLVGWGARTPVPKALRRALLGAFARFVGADVAEAELGLDHYASVGDFFARRLRTGARAVAASSDAVIAPCDGAVAAAGRIEDGTLLQAKGRSFSLAALLADEAAAAALLGGSYAVIYLSPRDYHRVHTPVDAELTAYDYLPGSRWPVSPRWSERVPGLLARNERVAMHLVTEAGPAAVVMVAAAGVGNIWLSHLHNGEAGAQNGHAGGDTRRFRGDGEHRRIDLAPPAALARGDELGAFLLGSTVVLVLPPGSRIDLAAGDSVRFGQRIGGLDEGQGA